MASWAISTLHELYICKNIYKFLYLCLVFVTSSVGDIPYSLILIYSENCQKKFSNKEQWISNNVHLNQSKLNYSFFSKSKKLLSFLPRLQCLSPLHRWHYLFNSHNQFSFFLFFWPCLADIKNVRHVCSRKLKKRGNICSTCQYS